MYENKFCKDIIDFDKYILKFLRKCICLIFFVGLVCECCRMWDLEEKLYI